MYQRFPLRIHELEYIYCDWLALGFLIKLKGIRHFKCFLKGKIYE